jgi:ribosome assembly protein RRB1
MAAHTNTIEDAMEIDSSEQTFILGRSTLQPGQSLTPDTSTYEMLHTLSTPWPCLSFDIVRDNLGDNRKHYPRTLYAVAGTQAEASRSRENELMILKLSSLSRMDRGNETDSESDSDSDKDEAVSTEPILESRSIPLPSTTNRIRSFQPPFPTLSDPSRLPSTITATSLENAQILIHDVTPHLQSLSSPGNPVPSSASKPLSTLRMHKDEGYAVDWSPASQHPLGRLLTGDCNGAIYSTQRTEGGGWVTDNRPFTGHNGSIEEIQWSPSEKNVFASASSDGSVKVWDVRSKSRKPAVDVKISNSDVNVMSWSRSETYLLATGVDDGEWAVWDLRQWKPQQNQPNGSQLRPSPIADFKFHKKPITSIEWHPTDNSVVALACADNTATLWDLSVELDDEEYSKESSLGLGEGSEKVPPQLLFIHHVEDGKEIHWHPQMPGFLMVTGGGGLGVFKTISV